MSRVDRCSDALRIGLLVLALAGRALAGVLIVDPNGFGDHTTLQAAIDAAANGDIIVVRPIQGWGDHPNVVGKSLTIVADAVPSTDTANLDLSISDVPAGGSVVVRGFHAGTDDKGALTIDHCAGAVWIEDCRFVGAHQFLSGGLGAAEIHDSPIVTLLRCSFEGGDGDNGSAAFPPFPPSPGGHGVLLVDSAAALYDCSVNAGDGGFNDYYLGADGAHGLELQGSSAILSGSTVIGGDWGGSNAAGGDGLRLDGASTAQRLDSTIAAGLGGLDVDAPPGAVEEFTGTARSLTIPGPKRVGQGGLLTLQGVQGDVIWYFVALKGGSVPLPGKRGWFLLDPSIITGPFPLGTITDPGGSAAIFFVAPSLPSPAIQGQVYLLQPLFVNTDGITLGAASSFVLLKAGL